MVINLTLFASKSINLAVIKQHFFGVPCTLLLITIALIWGCKKSDLKQQNPKVSQNYPKDILEKLKAQGGQVIIPINESVKGFVSDENGTPKVFSKKAYRSLSTDPALCDDQSSINSTATLISLSKAFTCNVGYNVNVVWEISTNVDMLVTANPNNSSQLSKGKLQLRNSSNALIYSQASITPISITDLGADPINRI